MVKRAPTKKLPRPILGMTAKQARAFLLKPESYCNIELPVYFTFSRVLAAVDKQLGGKQLSAMSSKPRDHEGVNYSMLSNKDGRHAWRPFQIIHPALYVSLVDQLTEPATWKQVVKRFGQFCGDPRFECTSIPVQATDGGKDRAAQILNWWHAIEQRSIELAMDYNHVFQADITDCYGSIYTHSIAWAMHTKPVAKSKRNDRTLIGNVIDGHIQDMRHGQTNGIPQGSVLMDFIAEMVLGYADSELANALKTKGISGFHVLRYRDDYRVFVNSPEVGELVLKSLTEVLSSLGLKLNSGKTSGSLDVVGSALKPDKLAWLRGRQRDGSLQKHLLIIHAHGDDFPNAGSLVRALTDFHARLSKTRKISDPVALISIAVDIAYRSPRAFPVCAAIVSLLLTSLENDAHRLDAIRKTYHKLSRLPNTGHMEVWLQRITHPYERNFRYTESMCEVVKAKPVTLWNNQWITSPSLKAVIDPSTIVNRSALKALKPTVKPREIAIFKWLAEFSS